MTILIQCIAFFFFDSSTIGFAYIFLDTSVVIYHRNGEWMIDGISAGRWGGQLLTRLEDS